MIKNDYILTSSDRIQNALDEALGGAQEHQRKNIQMSKQLEEVIASKERPKQLTNPVRPLAKRYVDSITRNSSLSPIKRRLLHSYLSSYVKRIPWYMKDSSTKNIETTTNNLPKSWLKRKRQDSCPSIHKTLLTRLLSPKKLRSKTEIKTVKKKVPLKKTQFSTTVPRQEESSIEEPSRKKRQKTEE